MNIKAILAAGAIAVMGSAASAAVVKFEAGGFVKEDGAATNVFDVTVSDIAGGVNVAVALSGTTTADGDVLLVGLEGANLSGGTFTINADPQTGDGITAICTDGTTSGCGPNAGGDFGGGAFKSNGGGGAFFNAYGYFDTIVRIGSQGSSNGNNNGFSFDITDVAGLSATDFTVAGLRVQSTPANSDTSNSTSLKLYNDDPEPVNPVPLPAAGWLLLAGLGGMAAMKRRKG